LNSANEEKVTVTFNEFTANKAIKEELFNNKLIMDNKTNLENENVETPTILLTVGHILDGTTLSSQELTDSLAILCYSGDKSYTIVAEVASTYFSTVPIYEFDDLEVMKYGIMMFNDYGGIYYHEGLEVSIYSSDLDITEMVKIAEEMVFE
jgi:hypothetical protein